jgi:hypothetical protein
LSAHPRTSSTGSRCMGSMFRSPTTPRSQCLR